MHVTEKAFPIPFTPEEVDLSVFYFSILLVEIKTPLEIKELYHNGLFHYKKELSLLKIAQANRRHGDMSDCDFTSSLIRPWIESMRTCSQLDKGAVPFIEQVEKYILYAYDCYCMPTREFSSTATTSAFFTTIHVLQKRKWPEDFLLSKDHRLAPP